MRMQITFTSGAQIVVDTDEFTSLRSRLDGSSLNGLNWTSPPDWTAKLHWLRLSEVVAIVAVRDGSPFHGAADSVKESLTSDPEPAP